MTEQPTVFIVEDDDTLRDALETLMKSINYNVESFQNAEEFLATYTPTKKECLILDVRMPKMSGLELQEKLNQQNSTLPIIFISGHGDIQMAVTTIKEGAIDFITKPFRHQKLIDLVNKGFKIDKERKIRMGKINHLNTLKAQLTEREQEIMGKILDGKFSKEISTELDISPNTVDTHRANIFKKMRVKTLSELIRLMTIPKMNSNLH